MSTIFSISGLLVMPFWLMMALLPRWSVTERVMRSPWIVLPPAILYAVLVLPRFGEIMGAVQRPELASIAALLGSEAGATIAWAHFLAFDLFVGRWVYLDSREQGVSAWLMAPILYLCLMLGPIGLLVYAGLRAIAWRRSGRTEAVAAT
jgi:hypothetical protein